MPGKAVQKRADPTTNSKKTYTKKQFMDFYGEFNGPKMWKKAGQSGGGGGGRKAGKGKGGGGGGGEKRKDPTVPKSKKTYSKQQFIDFYGKKNGLKVWKIAGDKGAKGKKSTGKKGKTPKKEKKVEKRRDPTNPKSKATYTLQQFIEFYGKKNGPKVWAKAPRKKQIVLVTGATGRIGKEVIANLAQKYKKRFIIRACSHNPEKAEFLKKIGATQLVKFDYKDPDTWKDALKGVEFVYSSSLDPLLEHHLKFCEYLGTIRKQLKLVVRVSCMGADTNTASYNKDIHVSRQGAEIPLMLQHYWWGEKALLDAKVPTCVLRNNFFMNHLLKTDQENIQKETGAFFSNPLGDCRNSLVCTNDIGYAAAVIIAQGKRHQNKFYDLTGPEPQSMYEVAADLSEVLGKTVEYKPQDAKQFEADFGPVRAAFFEYLSNGFYSRCSPDFYNITGKKPTSYKEYLTKKGAAGETGIDDLWAANLWKKGVDAMKDAAKVGK